MKAIKEWLTEPSLSIEDVLLVLVVIEVVKWVVA